MSQDVYVSCHTCGSALNHAKTSLPAGLSGLFKELGASVDDWNGRAGIELLPRLQSAIQQLETDLDYWRKHDDNLADSWSRVDFALPFLRALRDGFCRDPYATLSVS